MLERARNRTRNRGGFTLIELMVVVAVIAILAAIMTPFVTDYLRKTRLLRATHGFRSVIQKAKSLASNINTCVAVEVNRGNNSTGGYAKVFLPNSAVVLPGDQCITGYAGWAGNPARRVLIDEFDLGSMRQSGNFLSVQMIDLRIRLATPNQAMLYLLFDRTGQMWVGGPCAQPSICTAMIRLHSLGGDGLPLWSTLAMADPRRKHWIRELYFTPTGATRLTIYNGET